MRPERVGLEHQAEIAELRVDEFAGRRIEHRLAADGDAAAGRALQPGDRGEHGRLAAAGRTEQRQELALADVERDPVHRGDGAEALHEVGDRKISH